MNTETMSLPKARYQVELVKEGRSRFYRAWGEGWERKLQGTTGISGMMDDGKSYGFAKSAACITAGEIRSRLMRFGAEPVILEPDVVDAICGGAEKAYQQVWGSKRDRGTDYHAMLEARIKGTPCEFTEDFEEIWTALEAKLRLEGVDLVAAEVPAASLNYGFATKMDGVGRMMGDWGVCDWKFAKMINAEHFFQVGGGSAQAFTETYEAVAKWAKVFRWDFDGKFWEVKTVNNTQAALRGLLALRDVKSIVEGDLYV